MMSYKISVIVPVYNAESDLKSAIESIINQTFGFENIELILVDDASTDNSKEIIMEYQSTYGNIKFTSPIGYPIIKKVQFIF